MDALCRVPIETEYGVKEIAVFCCDIANFDEQIDILTTSAFMNAYNPTPNTIFRALWDMGISVANLAMRPMIDLRHTCHTWLSDAISKRVCNIHRIGCVELIGGSFFHTEHSQIEHSMLNSIQAYFRMLDIASIYDVEMDTLALPILGSGCQQIAADLMIVPLLNECISFLKRNRKIKRVYFIERNPAKANMVAEYVRTSYHILAQTSTPAPAPQKRPMVFISYTTPDRNVADNLCAKLEAKGLRVWYAPRNVVGPYAAAISKAIEECTHFVVILSPRCMDSQHVLNEIDLAFQRLPNHIKFKPLRINEFDLTPSFKYYLSRQHWLDAIVPPLEDRLNEFVDSIIADI